MKEEKERKKQKYQKNVSIKTLLYEIFGHLQGFVVVVFFSQSLLW